MVKQLRGLAIAATVAIISGLGVAAPATAQSTVGSIAGHLTDAGAPVRANVFVSSSDGTTFRYIQTDSNGFYRASDLPAGGYRVEFNPSWGGRQYAYQKLGWNAATVIAVEAGVETVVDDSLLPTGSLTGRFTAQDGSGIAGVSVGAIGGGGQQSTTTDANGYWNIARTFAAPDYMIRFDHWQLGISQYAYGQVNDFKAAKIAVTAGATTTVNDVRLPTGDVRVVAKDSVTGAVLNSFYVFVANRYGSTETGEVVVEDIAIGTHPISVNADGYIGGSPTQVTVTAGEQTSVTVLLDPVATIEATVVDAATGAPLPGVCIAPVSGDFRPTEGCGNVSDANGKVSAGYLPKGKYQLVAFPTEAAGYGTQWVGSSGGTGKQHLAATIELAAGQTQVTPVIKMDRAGTLTGKVTKPAGGPATDGWAGVVPVIHGSGDIPVGSSGFDAEGRYTLDALGPYEWQLFFNAFYEAPQFSGGVGNRYLARSIAVAVGATSTYDFQLRAGVQVTTKVTGIERPYPTVRFYNAITGDLIAHHQMWPDQFTVTKPVVGPQFVKIAVEDGNAMRWYGGADQAHARLVWIPAGGSKTIEINFS